MAALVVALHDSSLSVLERLKVAHYLWLPGRLLPAERSALMLQWACHELCQAYSKKNKAPPPHVTRGRLWGFLCMVLERIVEGSEVLLDLTPLSSHLFQVCSGVVNNAVCIEGVGLASAGNGCGFLHYCSWYG